MEERVTAVLESIGFNKNEIKVYLDLLKYHGSSALEISKRTGIHRSNTYDALRELINRGFVREIIKVKKRTFIAMDPRKILDYVKQKENDVNLILPYLNGISYEHCDEENVSIEKGVFAAREGMIDLLRLNKPITTVGISDEVIDLLGERFLKDFHEKRIKKKIPFFGIYDESALKRVGFLNKLKYSEGRYLSRKYISSTITLVCGDLVFIAIFHKFPTIIKIKNKDVADAYSNYFQLSWRQARII